MYIYTYMHVYIIYIYMCIHIYIYIYIYICVRRSFVCPHRYALASQHAQHFQHLFENIDLRQSPHSEGAKTDPPPPGHTYEGTQTTT